MQVFFKVLINDKFKLNIAVFKYWLNTKMKNWMYLCLDDSILCICDTDNYSKATNLGNAFKKCFCKDNDCEFIIESINDDDKLGICLIKNFIKNEIVLDCIDVSVFKVFTINGYSKSKLLDIIKYSYKNMKDILVCEYCNKSFSSNRCKRIHLDKYCKSKDQYGIELENKILKKENVNLKTENSILKDQLKEQKVQPIINITQTNNIQNQNIQTNINISTKKDKLNTYYDKTIDMDTFIDKYKNDPKYQLTSREAEVLLDILEFNGYIGYSNGLSTYLKNKCDLIFNDIHNNPDLEEQSILPFINNDTKHRTHYEKNKSSWVVVKNDENLKEILLISNNQLYNHHNKNAIFNSRETKMVINNLLKKTDLGQLKIENDQNIGS